MGKKATADEMEFQNPVSESDGGDDDAGKGGGGGGGGGGSKVRSYWERQPSAAPQALGSTWSCRKW
jgi:hypothetical protein